MSKKTLIAILIFFFSFKIVYASRNIIIIIDKNLTIFNSTENEEIISDNKGRLLSQLNNEIRIRLNNIINEKDNVSYYAYNSNGASGFFSKRFLQKGLAVANTALYKVNGFSENSWQYSNVNFYDLLNKNSRFISNDSSISLSLSNALFDTTLLITFSNTLLNSLASNNLSSVLTLNHIEQLDFSKSFLYNYVVRDYSGSAVDPEEKPVSKKINFYETVYSLTKKLPNFFLGTVSKPVILKTDRKTTPNADFIQLFPIADTNVSTVLTGETKAKIEECKILYVKGKTTDLSLTKSGNINWFSQHNNVLLANSCFPLYSILKESIIINENTPFEKEYFGCIRIRYNLIESFYSHAIFTDTLFFKIEIKEPATMLAGILNPVRLDNATLLKYAHKQDANKEWTQAELAKRYKGNIKIVLAVIALLIISLIFLIKRYIIDKKRLTISQF